MFSKQKGCKAIHLDANDSPLHQLAKWKRMVEKKKELTAVHKEKAKRRLENPQQQDDCPRLRCEGNKVGSKLWPYWAFS